MTRPINLGKARKARAKADKQQRATENRIRHGRTKAEKTRDKIQDARARQSLDQTRRGD